MIVELVGDYAFAIAVGIKVNCSRWDHTGEIGAEAFKEGAPAFELVDVSIILTLAEYHWA
jgi:hypothetical protein